MSISDTLTRVIIVIEHPQIQLAIIIPIYIKQVIIVILIIIMSILELIVTGLFYHIFELKLYLVIAYTIAHIYNYNYTCAILPAHMILILIPSVIVPNNIII